MYFDELYFTFLVGGVMALSWVSATFDKYIVDGLVNLAGWTVRQASVIAGLNDKYVVDGAVNGIATVTQDMGAAVRAPQTGRIRMYVTVLMAAIATRAWPWRLLLRSSIVNVALVSSSFVRRDFDK